MQDINEYQRASQPLNERVFSYVSELLEKNFRLPLTINYSGSHSTGLHTRESNLNMIVSYLYKKFDKEKQNYFVRNIHGFFKTLQSHSSVSEVSLEMKKFLSIINLNFTSNSKTQKVEIVFIYFQNDLQLSKDEAVKLFL